MSHRTCDPGPKSPTCHLTIPYESTVCAGDSRSSVALATAPGQTFHSFRIPKVGRVTLSE